jgi:hypothetical protein
MALFKQVVYQFKVFSYFFFELILVLVNFIRQFFIRAYINIFQKTFFLENIFWSFFTKIYIYKKINFFFREFIFFLVFPYIFYIFYILKFFLYFSFVLFKYIIVFLLHFFKTVFKFYNIPILENINYKLKSFFLKYSRFFYKCFVYFSIGVSESFLIFLHFFFSYLFV